MFFFYDIFPEGQKILSDLGVTLHSLATWWDVLAVAKESGKFDAAKLAEVEKFMHDPAGWSKAHGGVAAGGGMSRARMRGRARAVFLRSCETKAGRSAGQT